MNGYKEKAFEMYLNQRIIVFFKHKKERRKVIHPYKWICLVLIVLLLEFVDYFLHGL